MDPLTLVVVVLLLLLLLGYGGYGRARFVSPAVADVLVFLFVVIALVWLFGWRR